MTAKEAQLLEVGSRVVYTAGEIPIRGEVIAADWTTIRIRWDDDLTVTYRRSGLDVLEDMERAEAVEAERMP